MARDFRPSGGAVTGPRRFAHRASRPLRLRWRVACRSQGADGHVGQIGTAESGSLSDPGPAVGDEPRGQRLAMLVREPLGTPEDLHDPLRVLVHADWV